MLLAAIFLWAPLALAQHDTSDIEAGRTLFRKACSGCHGDNAKGGRGSDLTGDLKYGAADEALRSSIVQGIPGTQMPPFPFAAAEVRQLIAFLHSLRQPAVEAAVSGDPGRGRTLFFGEAGCSKCHMAGGRGGRLGPDLTNARSAGPANLRKSMLEPSARFAPGFVPVELTAAGSRIRGVRKNEDAFSVQIMDEKERLVLREKSPGLAVRRLDASLMPAANPSHVDHLIAFLMQGAMDPPVDWTPAADLNVTSERLRNARREPHNWLTYFGDLAGTHSTALASINTANVQSLASVWNYQFGATNNQTTPLVVDGVMFLTGPQNNAAALDARTGRTIWKYTRRLPQVASHCTVMTNRGFAILGDRLYMATLDSHLVALDAKTGNVIFDVEVIDYRGGYTITHAPLAVDGKIFVGVTAGECALVGFLDAYDARTGKRLWRLRTTPEKGDPARATWSGDSPDYGGSPTWMTGTYDVDTGTLFWTTGNPSPDYDGTVREGDNLWSCSVLAIDPATGKMKWFFQYTPHDTHDWDANETPMLVDAVIRGAKRKLLVMANRNAFFYAIDRVTGEFVHGKPFAKQTWAKGLDDKGRPMVIPNTDPTPEGNYACPDAAGAANWGAPSYDAATGLFLVSARDTCATYFRVTKPPVPGQGYTGGGQETDEKIGNRGFVRAIDPANGNIKWEFDTFTGSWSAGILATAGGVTFAGTKDGYLLALNTRSGALLWKFQTGSEIRSAPISFAVDGRQYISITSDAAVHVFALPKRP